MPKDSRFAERDNNGNRTTRAHDTVPVKHAEGGVVDRPRVTERAALDNAAYGEFSDTQTQEQLEAELYATGKYQYCSKCGDFLPADTEHFKNDSRTKRKFSQPCKRCDTLLSRRRQWEGAKVRLRKKSVKARSR